MEEQREAALSLPLGDYTKLSQAEQGQAFAADPTVSPINAHGGKRRGDISVLHCNTEKQGNSQAYLVRRLKRDAPVIAEDLAMTPPTRSESRRGRARFKDLRGRGKSCGRRGSHTKKCVL